MQKICDIIVSFIRKYKRQDGEMKRAYLDTDLVIASLCDVSDPSIGVVT